MVASWQRANVSSDGPTCMVEYSDACITNTNTPVTVVFSGWRSSIQQKQFGSGGGRSSDVSLSCLPALRAFQYRTVYTNIKPHQWRRRPKPPESRRRQKQGAARRLLWRLVVVSLYDNDHQRRREKSRGCSFSFSWSARLCPRSRCPYPTLKKIPVDFVAVTTVPRPLLLVTDTAGMMVFAAHQLKAYRNCSRWRSSYERRDQEQLEINGIGRKCALTSLGSKTELNAIKIASAGGLDITSLLMCLLSLDAAALKVNAATGAQDILEWENPLVIMYI